MKTNLVIIVIAIIVAAGVGYFAFDAGKQQGIAEARASIGSFFGDTQRFPNAGAPSANTQGGGQRGQAGQAPGGGNTAAFFGGVMGTVDKVDGNALTVTVTRGQQTQTIKVMLASDTAVQQIVNGSLSDVKVGTRILVGADRTAGAGGAGQALPTEIAARTITVLPANFTQ